MTVTKLLLPDAAATRSLGADFGQVLPAGSVLLLKGDLGSGKTTFVQGLGVGLGIQMAIDSPTFTLINEYLDGRLPLYHIDLYRLDVAEAADLHLESYWAGQELEPGIVVIEWAERLPYQPSCYLSIDFVYAAGTARQLKIIQSGQKGFDLDLDSLSQG